MGSCSTAVVAVLVCAFLSVAFGDCCNGICCGSGTSCCNGTCCDAPQESCCPDPKHGSVCCVKENTFCCPPDPEVGLPSRCCPRWNVCCRGGQYGCCDPGQLKSKPSHSSSAFPFAPNLSLPSTAFSLFTKSLINGSEPMRVVRIDLAHGTKSEVTTTFNTWQEISRTFAYASSLQLFVLPQTNFLQDQQPVRLSTISVTSGATKHLSLTQCNGSPSGPPVGLVTGFCWAPRAGRIMLASYAHSVPQNASSSPVGYHYFSVDPTTGSCNYVASRAFPQQQDDYSGWFKRCSQDGKTLFRMGFQNVVDEIGYGVQMTLLQNKSNVVSYFSALSSTPSSQNVPFTTFDVAQDTAPFSFLSLATESSALGDGTLQLLQWQVSSLGSPASLRVVSTLSNAHPPPKFGPVSTTVDTTGNIHVALSTSRNALGGAFERWKVSVTNVSTGKVDEHDLSPWMMAELDNAAGVGL